MRGYRLERSVQSILGNEYVAQAGASAEQGDVQCYIGIIEEFKANRLHHTSPILLHACCICSLYTLMVYSKTVIFSTINIECSWPVVSFYILNVNTCI